MRYSTSRPCQHCGAMFLRMVTEIQKNNLAFCGKKCSGAFRSRKAKADFWRNVKFSKRGCWEWTGAKNACGYGIVKGGLAHRVAWGVEVGPIPSGMNVCHRCDNPACVTIDHMFLGTHIDNMYDMLAKGRGTKLSDQVIRKIKSSTGTASEAGRKLGVSATTVTRYRECITRRRFSPSCSASLPAPANGAQ